MRKWLRDSRKEKGLTMEKMAALLGISESYYCMIENGERQKRIDILLLLRLSEVLEKPITEIIKLEAQ